MIGKSNSYFYCYNAKLRRFITDRGIKWVEKGINPKSGYPYWAFENTDVLSGIIQIYKKYE